MAYPSRRTTIAPTGSSSISGSLASNSTTNSATQSLQRNRQYTHLASQLAQLNANLADTENLVRMTSCQAEVVRGLGAWMGGLFMAASKVLGEEGVATTGVVVNGSTATAVADSSNGTETGTGSG